MVLGTWETIIQHDDAGSATFDQNITFTPSDYVGPAGNQLELRFVGFSDGAWSDEDCLWDTQGLAQVDNIRVTIGASVWYEDHEDGDNDHWVQVFDSGVGGLSVVREMRTLLPALDIRYFSDARHVPYGDKREAFVCERAVAISEFLLARGARALVVACNTATAAAAALLRARFEVPIVAIEPFA